jgi:hypothetical protein
MALNRRDFLFLRRTPRGRVLELSCRDLYMRAVNAEAVPGQGEHSVYDHEPWMGEPPADFETSASDDWLRQIENQLKDVDVLTLLDDEWLKATPINDQIEPVIAAFRARGGRVEFGKG